MDMVPYSSNSKHVFYIVSAIEQYVEKLGTNYDGYNNLGWKSETHANFEGNGGESYIMI